jgi:hypothetical protein
MSIILTVAALWAGAHHPGCNTTNCERRVDRHEHAKTVDRWRRVARPYRAWLDRVVWCESRGDYHANTGNGFFGGLQFTLPSWQAVGGRRYPHLASAVEQRYRGVRLLAVQGPGAWPVCGR